MSNTAIKLKKSSVVGKVPIADDLQFGELAINYADGKIYYKNSSNQIKAFIDSENISALIATGGGGGSIDADTLNGQAGSYYLDYVNFTNTPTIPTLGTDFVDSAESRKLVSVTDAGGDGSLSYNNSTGVFTYTGPSALEVRAHFSGGTGITITDGVISTTDSEIVHDNLSGFVANEHIDHSTVSITAGTGLTGGGDITESRTLSIGNTGVTAATYGDSSTIPRITVNAQGQITAVVGASVNIPPGYGDADVDSHLSGGTGITYNAGVISTNDSQIVHDNLSGFVVNEHIDHSSVSITAGSGLTGGGDITSSRTLNIGAGTGVIVNADNIAIGQPVGTSDTPTFNGLSAGNSKITSLALPTTNTDAANKAYVDEVAQGLAPAPAVTAATTSNLAGTFDSDGTAVGYLGIGTLTATVNGAIGPIDGVAIDSGDSLLLKDQTAAFQNGRYNVAHAGDAGNPWVLVRCSQCDSSNEIAGKFIFIVSGTLFANTGWVLTVENPDTFVINQDPIVATQFSGAGSFTAGYGLNLDGAQFSLDSSETITITREGLSAGTGINYSSSTGVFSTNDAQIVHDNLSGFVANEHIDHSAVSITAGAGLTGGGTIAATRTISHADTSTQASVDNSNGVVIQDVTLDDFGHVTALGSIDLDNRFLRSDVNDTFNGNLIVTGGLIVNDNNPKLRIVGSGSDVYLQASTDGTTGSGTNINFSKYFTADTTMTVDTLNERVGIGTTSPSATLHIASGSPANDNYDLRISEFRPSIVLEDLSTSAVDWQIYVDGNSLSFLHGDASTNTKLTSEAMAINSSGNVGIGTSSPAGLLHLASSSGDTKLIIEADADNNNEDDNAFIIFRLDGGLETAAIWHGNADGANDNSLNLACSTSVSGGIRFFTNNVNGYENAIERMRINATGNVGIGTTTPAATLQVNAPSTTAASLTFGATSGQIFRNENSELAIGLLNSSPFPLYIQGRTNNNVGRDLALQPLGGSVGIGTTSPQTFNSTKLDVSGSIHFNNNALIAGQAGENNNVDHIWHDDASATIGSTNTSGVWHFVSDGTYKSTGGSGIKAGAIELSGSLVAATKSFVIDHPSKKGYKLRYGSLEGPENGVYVRGKSKEKTFALPDYWKDLVFEDSITVQLTAIGPGTIYVTSYNSELVTVDGTAEEYFYYVLGERKDTERFEVEYREDRDVK